MSLRIQRMEPLSPRTRAKKLGLASSRFRHQSMSNSAYDKIRHIKKRHRSQLKGDQWRSKGYYKSNATQQLFSCPDEIERVDCRDLSVEMFVSLYEGKNKPVVIQGVTRDWQVDKHLRLDKFYEQCKNVQFKAGEDDKGKKMRIKLKYYIQYLVYNHDDSPLYLFESSLQSRAETRPIVNWYNVPQYFKDDLFQVAGQKHRPPYRWLLIGPQRSGSTVHIDPLHTSAWNTSLRGHKRWVLFKEEVPKFIVKGNEFKKTGQDIEAIDYFTSILPKIIAKQGRQNLGVIQFIQYPGETVFVPGGWWHAVINLDDTFAVTQNVMTHVNFETVWTSLRKERPKFGAYFLKQLQKKKDYLYQKAVTINERDDWVMGKTNRKNSLSRSPSGSSSSSSSSSYNQTSEDSSNSRSRSRDKHRKSSATKRS